MTNRLFLKVSTDGQCLLNLLCTLKTDCKDFDLSLHRPRHAPPICIYIWRNPPENDSNCLLEVRVWFLSHPKWIDISRVNELEVKRRDTTFGLSHGWPVLWLIECSSMQTQLGPFQSRKSVPTVCHYRTQDDTLDIEICDIYKAVP